jgi:hypothetical protein
MIVTFKEKNNQKYEIDNAKLNKIFEDTKSDILNVFEKYKQSDFEELIYFTFSLGSLFDKLQQSLSDKYGADKMIEVTNAKPIKEDNVQ